MKHMSTRWNAQSLQTLEKKIKLCCERSPAREEQVKVKEVTQEEEEVWTSWRLEVSQWSQTDSGQELLCPVLGDKIWNQSTSTFKHHSEDNIVIITREMIVFTKYKSIYKAVIIFQILHLQTTTLWLLMFTPRARRLKIYPATTCSLGSMIVWPPSMQRLRNSVLVLHTVR